jgi:hypothetical protein
MSGAIARQPRSPKYLSWWRQLSDSSGQPCAKMMSGASRGPLAR